MKPALVSRALRSRALLSRALLSGVLTVALTAASASFASSAFASSAFATPAPQAPGTSGTAAVAEKQEIVYVNLNADGSVSHASVVNHFTVERAGTLTDRGAYSAASNLSSTQELELAGSKVSVSAEAGDFYYQGELSAPELPWVISLTYKLDGKTVSAAELAGASGALVMELHTKKNPKAAAEFFENYMLQATVTLDNAHASHVVAPDATLAAQGSSTIATFMVLPGKQGNVSLEAQISNFAMGGIQIAGLPLSLGFDLPSTASMMEDMDSLVGAIVALDEGVAQLSNGAGALDAGSGQMLAASAQIDGALALIASQVGGSLGDVDLSALAQLPAGLEQLAQALSASGASVVQMRDGLSQSVAALDAPAALGGFVQTDVSSLQTLLSGSTLGQTESAALGTLLNNYSALATAYGTWYGPSGTGGVKAGIQQTIAGLDSLASGMGQMSGTLTFMSNQIATGLGSGNLNAQLSELAAGLALISSNYHLFHGGLAVYTNGVSELAGGTGTLAQGTGTLHHNVADLPKTMQNEIDKLLAEYDFGSFEPVSFLSPENKEVSIVQFVYLTPSITAPEPPAPESTPEPEKGFFDLLFDLFS